MSVLEFSSIEEASEFVQFRMSSGPVLCRIDGELWHVWGGDYAERVPMKDGEV